MARPRIIRLPEKGEITLKNIDITKAAAIQEYILSCYDAGKATTPLEETVEESVANEFNPDLKHEALSLFKDKKGIWFLVTLSYNPYTKESEISNLTRIGDNIVLAQNKFKMEAFAKGLV